MAKRKEPKESRRLEAAGSAEMIIYSDSLNSDRPMSSVNFDTDNGMSDSDSLQRSEFGDTDQEIFNAVDTVRTQTKLVKPSITKHSSPTESADVSEMPNENDLAFDADEPKIEQDQSALEEMLNGFGSWMEKRASGKSREKNSTKSTKIACLKRVVQDCKINTLEDMTNRDSIDKIMEAIDSWKVNQRSLKDGTKIFYVLYIIQFLQYIKDEGICTLEKVSNINLALERWGRMKQDLTRGLLIERSEKSKRDADHFESGKMIDLADCYKSAIRLRKDIDVVKFENPVTENSLKLLYCYIIVWMCLKSLIRPSVFARMTCGEFNDGKYLQNRWDESLYVVRVMEVKAKLNNTGFVCLTEEICNLIESYLEHWRPQLLKDSMIGKGPTRRTRKNHISEDILFLDFSTGLALESDEIDKLMADHWLGEKKFSFNYLRKHGHTEHDLKRDIDFSEGAQHT